MGRKGDPFTVLKDLLKHRIKGNGNYMQAKYMTVHVDYLDTQEEHF